MKKLLALVSLSLMLCLVCSAPALSAVGTNSCGYTMDIVSAVQGASAPAAMIQPQILDAWTTNDPINNPYLKVTNFVSSQDTLGFVINYRHAGGSLPQQFARGWVCGDETQIVKTCNFQWTIPYLPPGDYLLINYFDRVNFTPGVYDWAVKVGDIVYGWPEMVTVLPQCITIQP